MVKSSDHGRFLQEIGMGDDLKICAEIDSMPVLPQMEGNVLKLKRETEKKTAPNLTATA
jgi:phosphosulfolactate phosphohydrolase-like enzyme